jgi:hypothetical protein
VKQCSLLIVDRSGRGSGYRQALELRGFRVTEVHSWPDDRDVLDSEAVIVFLDKLDGVHMLAARMRAKPRFGRRILMAIVPTVSAAERRAAVAAGFDDLVSESGGSRVLIARILGVLRTRPEHRCFLPDLRRRAA